MRGKGVSADPGVTTAAPEMDVEEADMGRLLGWSILGGQGMPVDLEDLLEPPGYLLDCADEAELLDGRPCCCLAANGSGVHDGECCPDCRQDD